MLERILYRLGLVADRGQDAAPSTTRSGKWPRVRKQFLKTHPECAACGGRGNLVVHHRHPFHLAPEKELDPANLITLCEAETHDCHLIFGHLLDFHSYNPHVALDTATFRARIDSRP